MDSKKICGQRIRNIYKSRRVRFDKISNSILKFFNQKCGKFCNNEIIQIFKNTNQHKSRIIQIENYNRGKLIK